MERGSRNGATYRLTASQGNRGTVANSRVRQVVFFGKNNFIARVKQYAEQFENAVVVGVQAGSGFKRRRVYSVRQGTVKVVPTGAMFCISCCCVRSLHEKYCSIVPRSGVLWYFCRECESELMFSWDIRPGIEAQVEKGPRRGALKRRVPRWGDDKPRSPKRFSKANTLWGSQ